MDIQVRHAARGILLTADEEVLLMRMSFPWRSNDLWILPGGGIEPGESALDAVIREVYEETGLRGTDVLAEVWRREFLVAEAGTLMKQRYFLLPVTRFEPQATALLGAEQDWVREYRWWSVDALAGSAIETEPEGIGFRLRALVAGGVPSEPLDLSGRG